MDPNERLPCAELLKHSYFTATGPIERGNKIPCKVQGQFYDSISKYHIHVPNKTKT